MPDVNPPASAQDTTWDGYRSSRVRQLLQHGLEGRVIRDVELIDIRREADRVLVDRDQADAGQMAHIAGEPPIGGHRPPAPDQGLDLVEAVGRLADGCSFGLGVPAPLVHLVRGHHDPELAERDIPGFVAVPRESQLLGRDRSVPALDSFGPDASAAVVWL
ncbi:MAG: hypothetical protein ACFHWZ_17035 [Phycisphaerales bacterium]